MSAKRQKKERAEIRVNNPELASSKGLRRRSGPVNPKLSKAITTVVGTLVVLGILALIAVNSTLFYVAFPALQIGEHSITAAEYNYQFKSLFAQSEIAMYVDSTKPLSKQASFYPDDEEGETLEGHFRTETFALLRELAELEDAAKSGSFTAPAPTPDPATSLLPLTVTEQISDLKKQSVQSGFGDFDDFLETNFGKGMSEELLQEILTKQQYAAAYSESLIETRKSEITDDERDVKYAEKADEYDLFTYYYYKVYAEGTTVDAAGAPVIDEAGITAARNTANEIASIARTPNDFRDFIITLNPDAASYYNDVATYRRYNVSAGSVPELYTEWLKDAARKEGDTSVFEESDGFTVVLYFSRNKNQYRPVSFRDITIAVDADPETGEYTESARQAAEAKANDLLNEWKESSFGNEYAEELFAAVATANSADTSYEGGLHEKLIMGAYTEELEIWLFDTYRYSGETAVIAVNSNAQPAYHIVYFVKAEEQQYDRQIAESLILNDFYDSWKAEREPQYEIKEKIGFNFRVK